MGLKLGMKKKNNVSFFKYLKDNFYLDGFLELLEDQIKKDKDLDYCILASCSLGKKNQNTLIKELYNVKSDFFSTWDRLRENGEIIPKLSSNFKLTYKREERKYDTFLTSHILKSKINLTYYMTAYFIDLDSSEMKPEFLILNSFKSLKDAKKSVSIYMKKFSKK